MLCVCAAMVCFYFVFFFFKQKTAYEMRISDWSSDVCSSDVFSSDLILGLPAGLGDLQAWITGLMTYPSLPMAGFTAWAVGAHFAMASVRIDSRRGLGVNEQFMALAPTGYGKEEIRAPFEILARELQETARPTGVPSAWLAALPKIQQIGRAHV